MLAIAQANNIYIKVYSSIFPVFDLLTLIFNFPSKAINFFIWLHLKLIGEFRYSVFPFLII